VAERKQTGELEAQKAAGLAGRFQAEPQACEPGDSEKQPANETSERAVAGDQRPGGAGVVDQ
jgi:hypothetical protein